MPRPQDLAPTYDQVIEKILREASAPMSVLELAQRISAERPSTPLVRAPEALRAAMSISGSYLLLGQRRDAIDVTPDSSRRARAIEVWAALKSLGRTGLADLIERNCRQATWLSQQLLGAGIEVLNDVVLNQVVVSFGDYERTRRAIAALQSSGECWCGSTTWRGRHAMRISVSSWATTQADLDRTLAALLAAWRTSEHAVRDVAVTQKAGG